MLISQLPAGQVDKHVFERGMMRGEPRQSVPRLLEMVEQERQRLVQLLDRQRQPSLRRFTACTPGNSLMRVSSTCPSQVNSTTSVPPSDWISFRGVPDAMTLPLSMTADRSQSAALRPCNAS